MSKDDRKVPTPKSSAAEVDAFLAKVRVTPAVNKTGERGRLLFAMDATASREPSWDMAARIQGEMFEATKALGGVEIQLAFYRGFGEFRTSGWTADAAELRDRMTGVRCLAGATQLGKVLAHAANETQTRKINALVFVGDAFEEDIDKVGDQAGKLGLLGVPAFIFHEGGDPIAGFAFQQVAKLTNGAYLAFDASSADTLKKLLGAVAVYAAGGPKALQDHASAAGGPVLQIAHQVRGK